MTKARLVVLLLVAMVMAGALAWALWPQPVPVDMVEIRRGPMEVTVSANGVTRIRDTYLVSAPMAGTTTRSPVEIGDEVALGSTVVATIQPAPPGLLDARSRLQAEAAIAEAEAALRHSESSVSQAEANLDRAASQFERARRLAEQGTIPLRMRDDAALELRAAEAALEAARSDVDRQRATLARARAVLVGPEETALRSGVEACCIEIVAPADGTVLSIENVSARPVQAGEPLLTIGRADDLEIEVELLSSDAVRIRTGAPARISRWGGPDALEARVRRIEPSARTRVSALGIEEQRVRVMLDLTTPVEDRPGLGDNFRVFVQVVEWHEDDVLQVPVGALFRSGEDWAVHRFVDGSAVQTAVTLGRRTSVAAQVLGGLNEGDVVVLYPGDRVQEGTRLRSRDD